MVSEEISPEDAALILHKWITESTKLQASFVGESSGVFTVVTGLLKVGPDKTLVVLGGEESNPETPNIRFNPLLPSVLRYQDARAVKEHPPAFEFFSRTFVAALSFTYPDGSVLALFEAV
jgi:hypothetical protein